MVGFLLKGVQHRLSPFLSFLASAVSHRRWDCCFKLFTWLRKAFPPTHPSDRDTMTNTPLEAIASSSGKNDGRSLTSLGHANSTVAGWDTVQVAFGSDAHCGCYRQRRLLAHFDRPLNLLDMFEILSTQSRAVGTQINQPLWDCLNLHEIYYYYYYY